MIRPAKDELKKYNVDYPKDTPFSAFARLLQSKWRENKLKLRFSKYGNFLPADIAIETKANFLTEKIRTLVQYVLYRNSESKQLIREDRLWENLLSSQPLCFNLFGELHFDKRLATKFFTNLFPDRIKSVTEILFEYSPSRGNENFTGDHSAFDVFVEYISTNNDKKGFIGIEVKYAEMPISESKVKEKIEAAERIYNKHKTEYHRVAEASGLFSATRFSELGKLPLQQIWRDHLLALSLLQNGNYEEGFLYF
jgi:hypothetical protein